MQESPNITIGVLCYNEVGSIEHTMEGIQRFIKSIPNLLAEVLVVDDGSADESVALVKRMQNEYSNVKLIEHGQNRGIGMALRTIYDNANGNVITYVPGDGQFDIEELRPFVSLAPKTLVNLYRVENTTYSVFRNGLSLMNKLLNRYFVGLTIKDVNWILIFRKDELSNCFPLHLKSSLVTSEICAKMVWNGCKILDAPSRYLPRKAGKSRGASFKIVVKAAIDTLNLLAVIWKFKLKNKRIK